MICTIEQIANIIKNNPNKALIELGVKQAKVLKLNIQGTGMDSALTRNEYFENEDVFKVRNADAISNMDMFGRLFQREEMVFNAQGGATVFEGLEEGEKKKMVVALSDIRYEVNLRTWIKTFALQAYRCDPMGVIFMEYDTQKTYPTYKCIESIYDYLPNGRSLEYISFRLKKADAVFFGVTDPALTDLKDDSDTDYYRFVDDAFDYILKYDTSVYTVAIAVGTKRLKNPWKKTPAFLASHIMKWDQPSTFLSPIYQLIELSGCFMKDRSVRDLQKKFSGFAKAIEPLLKCGTCLGATVVSGSACPDCTPAGATQGTGYKLRTKVADVARFPLDLIEKGFDFNKFFGYVSPKIDIWDKQDTSLNDLENLMNDVYWGTDNRARTSGVDAGDKSVEETATKTLTNLQPIYTRLNYTADYAQKTENLIANFVGKFLFPLSFKGATITYGRYYILETPDELMAEYLDMRSKGAAQSSLFDTLRKYYHSLYNTNPNKLAIMIKLIDVEPFVHSTIQQVQATNISKQDYMMKVYFSEWLASKTDDYLFVTNEEALRADLLTFATAKALEVENNPLQEPIEPKTTKKIPA